MISDPQGIICPVLIGEGDTGADGIEEQQAFATLNKDRHLTSNLMEQICSPQNLKAAYQQVKKNKGAAGVDGMSTAELGIFLKVEIGNIKNLLKTGKYKPQPVLGIKIPKAGGGERQLGIPTVVDRFIQQAIKQVLEPLFDPTFSESSYGFRPRRSAHLALQACGEFVKSGRGWVVDLDIEKFFDQVNHDLLMSKLSQRIGDKILLRLIRRYLQAGMIQDGESKQRMAGTPQGSPLSPLLSNILLDELDKELEKRGHAFSRYADDCNIYVQSERAGQRVMESITRFLKRRLHLNVNTNKSAVAPVNERTFLGHRVRKDGALRIAPESLQELKNKVKAVTKRSRGKSLESVIAELNQILRGWVNYFKLTQARTTFGFLDAWIRRKLRCYRLRQCKLPSTIIKMLKKNGVDEISARRTASSGKGWWRLSANPALQHAFNVQWFEEQGLFNLEKGWLRWVKT